MGMTINGSNGLVFPDSTTMASGAQAVKAWVNFNGTGTVAIRAAYNVTSITDNGTGLYAVNFTTAMSDTNYAVTGSCWNSGGSGFAVLSANNNASITKTASLVGVLTGDSNNLYDVANVYVAIFR